MTPARPTLTERLERLAAEFDRNRIDLHVPGAVLAIVRGEDAIFARGFGVADIVLTNTLSPLRSITVQVVPQYLLGELPPAASGVGDLKPYLGRYVANFRTFSNEVFAISERNGRLVLDIPSKKRGREIFQVERVKVGVELAPDTFTLQPSTESGRGK